jgi:hypothetical protein
LNYFLYNLTKMGKMEGKSYRNTFIAVIEVLLIIGVIFLVTNYFYGYFNHPNPVRITQEGDKFCPKTLFFGFSQNSQFLLILKNNGGAGVVKTNIESEWALIKNKEEVGFSSFANKKYYILDNEYQTYEFILFRPDKVDKPDKIVIKGGYFCEGLFCKKDSFECNYEKKPTLTYDYVLTSESFGAS